MRSATRVAQSEKEWQYILQVTEMSLHCLCFNGEGEDRFSSEGSRALSRLVLFQGLHSRQESEPHDVLTQDLIGLEDMAHHSLYWLSCSLTAFGSGSMPSSSLPATGIAPLHGLSNRMNAQRHGRARNAG